MVEYNTVILKFSDKGEKTGWTYIEVPADIATRIKPGCKKSFQVKGWLDGFPIEKINILPIGGGSFILALNAQLRKGIRKKEGAALRVQLESDTSEFEYPADVMECFEEEPEALSYFNKLPGSHQRYFIKWIGSAKTDPTRTKRIAQTINACARRMGYGEMIRSLKAQH